MTKPPTDRKHHYQPDPNWKPPKFHYIRGVIWELRRDPRYRVTAERIGYTVVRLR